MRVFKTTMLALGYMLLTGAILVGIIGAFAGIVKFSWWLSLRVPEWIFFVIPCAVIALVLLVAFFMFCYTEAEATLSPASLELRNVRQRRRQMVKQMTVKPTEGGFATLKALCIREKQLKDELMKMSKVREAKHELSGK